MTTQFSVAARNAAADAIEGVIGAEPTLRIRTGALPASAAAARSGTILAEVVLAPDWLGNAVKMLSSPSRSTPAAAKPTNAPFVCQ